MFMSRVRIYAALIAAASMGAPVLAQDPEPAAQTAESRIESAIEFAMALTAQATEALTDSSKTEAQRLEAFQRVLADGLAIETIGRFMLGESRKTMSDEQTTRYETVFPLYITKLYAEQFDEIVGKPLEVIDAREIGARDVVVRTEFERKDDPPIKVDWRIRHLRSGELKAIDIIVSGVSIILVKRDEFSSFIAANGVDALIERLAEEGQA